MALVKFVTGTAASFAALTTKDADTLYFITDEKRIYKGSEPFSGGIHRAVTSYPTIGDINTIYVNTADGSAKFYNGTAWVEIVKPNVTALSAASTDGQLPTAKAVVDYVTSAIADQDISAITNRLDALEGRMTTAEGKLTTIQGTGDGSIAKALADAKAYTDALANGAVADNTSDIAALQTGKADKATTLAGYGITDAYTKTQTDTAISTAIANADHLTREIVSALPAVASASDTVIYMVPKTDGAGNQNYDEYMLINGAFEKVGDTAVDLTDYATKTEVATAKTEAIAAAGTAADSKITAAIGALDVADTAVAGKYVSAVSEVDGKITVTRADLPAAATLTTGTANGTVAFNGTDVAVKGLGSAAYTESSAYATAAQGAKADSAVQSVITGTTNGTIAVDGTDVAVAGLGSAAYTASTAYDAAGAAAQALVDAKAYVDAALTWQTL